MDFLKFDYLKYRKIYLIFSLVLIIFSLYFLLFGKMNLWIDLTWWVTIDYNYKNEINLEQAKEKLEQEKETFIYEWQKVLNNINVYSTTWEKTISLIAWFNEVSNVADFDELKASFRKKALEIIQSFDSTAEEVSYTNIWKTFWDYIKNTAYLTLGLAIIWMFLYVYYAFSGSVSWIQWFSFWFVTLLTLFHDVLASVWLYIFIWLFNPDFQIDIYFITALLTILWYSINDTIVIFDRIRENLRIYWGKPWNEWKNIYEIINLSVLETFKRSIFTSLTLFFVLLTIFFFWPETLNWFILVMILWTLIWTYSSIFIASPIFYELNKNKTLSVYRKKVYNPDDKIVV